MERRKVEVGELEFGMYVAELDRPWTETPFMFQGFLLKTEQQLAALKKFCKHVFIDLKLGQDITPKPAKPTAPSSTRGATAYPEVVSVEAEFEQAVTVYNESFHSIGELLKPA